MRSKILPAGALFLLLTASSPAQVSLTLQGPAQAVNCDSLTLTSRVQNAGATVANLWLTNQLPPSGYVYVPGASTVYLPGGVVVTGAAANPVNNSGGTNLGWDFSAVVTPSLATNLLITEVFYDPTNVVEDAYEWFEIYNPSTNTFAITNWSMKDAVPGSVDVLPPMTLAPGAFAIVAASTSAFFSAHPAYPGLVVQVSDGALGSGLNNGPGDGIFLRDAASNNVDAMSYGGSTAAFNPPVPFAPEGYSLVRNPANNDSNSRNDWSSTNAPNPGTGTVPVGLQNGGVITVVWKAEVSCDAVSGQFLSYATFEQPPGAKGTSTVSHFVTVSRPDLVVTKTPTLQEGGYGDFVTWTVRVENAGFGAAPNVVLTDNLGPGLIFSGFSINPTNGFIGSNVTWNASVIPAFTSLTAGAHVDVVVTAQLVACEGLYNSADAAWRCAGLLAATNAVCENTANNGQTATATLQFNDRHPSLSGSLSSTNLAVPYCGNANVTLFLTNATGPAVGSAVNIQLFSRLPDGWSYSVPPNLGTLLPGQSTSVVVTVSVPPGGPCPLRLSPEALFFYPYYFDGCDHFFYGPVIFASASVVNPPGASVTKTMPASAYTTFPVTVRFSYTNFNGSEVVTLTDLYPQYTNLSVANISPAGTLTSTTVVWTLSGMSGSGVRTTSFNMVYGSTCGGPDTMAFNTISASSFTDCRGCVVPVSGSGTRVPIRLTPGPGCPFNGGTNGGGNCYFYGIKSVSTGLTEACVPVTLTHTFTNFGGVALSNWTGVVFSSDLAGGQGTLGSTSSVQVVVNGSNLTHAVSITQTNPSLIVSLAGLNNTIYSNVALVTNGLSISWAVLAPPGLMADASTLLVPPCGESTDWAQWDVGASSLSIALEKIVVAEACGIVSGRIELNMNASPLFPVYDAEVVLDLDADTNLVSDFEFVTNSTAFSGLYNLSGTPLTATNPVQSGNRLTWSLGDLRTNGQTMAITYRLRASCDLESNGLMRAFVRYNNRCSDGTAPPVSTATSATNSNPFFFTALLDNAIEPELTFLVGTQYVVRLDFMNSGFGGVYNLRAEMLLPPNVVFGSAAIAPSFVSATNVVWTFQNASPFPGLSDRDSDGFYDDMSFLSQLSFWVTNYLTDCVGGSGISLSSSHGCGGSVCEVAAVDTASFTNSRGALVTRATFPDIETLCATNEVVYSVRNSGLTIDYNVQAYQTLPLGMTYVPGSSRVSLNNGPTNSIADPPGDGSSTNPLTWTSAEIPSLLALNPNDQVTILYNVFLGCEASMGDDQFISNGRFTDNCGLVQSNRDVISVLAVNEPLLQVNKSSLLVAADLNATNVYTIIVSHAAPSAANVPAMELVDVLPAAITFLGASPAPDAVVGQTLIWSNATLMSLVGDGAAPFTIAESSITIVVTGRVNDCAASVINDATVNYGCSVSNLCMTAHDDVSLITDPVLNPPGLVAAMQLNTCGGTKTVSVTNRGATANGMVMTETAPPGYVFVSASVTGEFNSAALNLVLSGSPLGRTGTVNFTTAAASGATDVDDDRGDGLANLDFGYNNGYTITYVLASDGTGLDCLADPTDLDFADPEQGDPTAKTSSDVLTYTNLCGEAGSVGGSVSAYPDLPDPDIDLQPNSLIVTNGQVLTNITATIRNNAEAGNAENLHVRLRFGTGWTNVALISSNIVSSGTTGMLVEIQGNTNVLVDLPGVILDPVDDQVVLVFRATVTTNGGFLDVLAEVVGDCDNGSISPACVFTNTLGMPPLADTMSGTIPAVNGQYYAFDQDRFVAAGLSLSKTVRYDDEAPAAAGTNRTARVGEDLIYRIEATYFGGIFSNVTITESLPAQLFFRDPASYAFSGAITGAVYNPGTGVFTLQPVVWSVNPSTFAVDIPVVVSNRADVQNGVVITNVAVTDYFLDGVTNEPTPRSTQVTVLEPSLVLTKTVNSNLVQSGDVIIFTNRLTHTGLSATSAYDIVFTDTLPYGLTFSGLSLTSDGMDNDGDAVIDEADEGTLVSGSTFTVTTNQNAFLGELAISNTVFFRFPALVTNQIIGATMINTSRVTWTSLDGVATNLNERDGSGGFNDYTNSATASLASRPIGSITKTFIASSQTNTLDGVTNDWTIGERLVYQIRVDVPQGVASNLVLTDRVPMGIDWVGGNVNAAMTYPGRGYEFEIPAGGPQFPTNVADGLVITDTDPTPTFSAPALDGSGSNVVFTFAAITNTADSNPANDYFLLRMEFVALNQATNVGILPTPTRSNNVVRVQDAFTTRFATSPVYRIVEHDVRTQKLRSSATNDAGDVITFTLIASNQVNALANAYDVEVEDTLSSNIYDVSSFTLISLPPGWGFSNTAVAAGLLFKMFSSNDVALPPNSGATGVFSVALAQDVRPNQVYTNRMDITISSTIYGIPPGGVFERADTANSSTNFRVPGFVIAKALSATSETNLPPDSTNLFVQIGERLTYRVDVTLPESTITNLSIFDVMPSNGLAYIRNSARVDTNSFVGFLPALSETPTGSGLLATNGQNITFNFFGNTVVSGDNNAGNNSFSLYLDVLALDTNQNSGIAGAQTVHTNRARVTYAANPVGAVTSAVVTTTMIEPRVQILKNIVQATVDAGDVVDIQLTVTNSGTATAYDLLIHDPLNSLFFDPATIANFTGPTGYTYSVSTTNLYIVSDTNAPTGTNTLEVGESLTFTFQVAMAGTLPPNNTVTNSVTIRSDSLRSTNIFAVQRTTVTGSFDSVLAGDFALTKTLYDTSEKGPSDSISTNLQIGEVATWQLETALPESTVSNLTFTDFLPTGLQYVANSLVVDTSSFNGTLAPATNITLSFGQVQFTFLGDTVVTADNNPANNTLRLRFDSVVLDTNWLTGLPPQTVMTNRATVTYANNPSSPATSGVVVVRVIEPNVLITKDIDLTFADAGDRAIITLTLTNSGLGTAYDVSVTDAVSAAMFSIASISNVAVPAGFTFAVVTNGINAAVLYSSDPASGEPTNTLEVSESLVFRFAADLAQGVEPGAVLTNYARVATADTIYGTNIFAIARDKSGSNAFDRVAISNMIIAKAFTGTSENGPVDTTGANAAIGERVSYRLTVTLPESTITNLAINDLLPAGMACVTSSVGVDVTGFGGNLPGAPTVAGNVSFTFTGLTVVTNDNAGGNNSFAITFDAVVRNIASNDGLPAGVDGNGMTVLSNRATVAYDGFPPAYTTSVVTVDVVEPSLLIRKTMSGPSNGLVDITFVVTNRGLATAYDVILRDTFPSNWWITGSIAGTMPTGFVYSVTNAPGDGYLTILSDTNTSQPTNTIEVGESLLFRFSAQVQPTARGVITNTVWINQYTTIDGTNVDERFEPTTNGTALLPLPDFAIAKRLISPSGRAAAVGEAVTFNIVVTNNGSMGLNPVRVDDTFSTTYLAFASAVPPVNGSGAGTFFWTNVGPLAIGGTTTLVVNFTAAASTQPGDTTNVVVGTVFTTNGLPLFPKTNSAPVEITTVGYTLSKTWTSPTNRAAQVGEAIQFSVTIVNTGEETLVTVPVADVYETNYLTYAGSVPPTVDNTNDGAISWTDIGPLPVGASTSLWLNFTARTSSQSLPRTNTVSTAPTTPGGTPPVLPLTNRAPYEISRAGYVLTKTRTSPAGRAAQVGEAVTFNVTISNTGDVQLVTVPVDDIYEIAYLTYIGSVPATVNNNNDGTINWTDVGPVAAGASTTLVLNFTAAASSLSIDHTNTVWTAPTVPPTEPPVLPQTNRAPYDVTLAGYRIDKVLMSPTNRPAIIGEPVRFEVRLFNTGDVALVTVPVTDRYETAYLTYTGSVPPTADNVNDGQFNWLDVGPLAVGASTTLVVHFTAAGSTLGVLRTNDVSAAPTTPTNEPPVPILGSNAVYRVNAPASLGDFVWNDLDADGIQDGGETGVANVAVTLYDFDGFVVGVTTTGVNGAYAFTNLIPAMYSVGVTVPGGYTVSPQNQGGDDAVDSDINIFSGQTGLYTLNAGQTNLTIDAGLYQVTALGDYVWEDVNGNGIQDGGEPPLTNVTVRLYDALTNVLATTATDAAGFYQFANLAPATYFVEFVAPGGYQFTRQDIGADSADSDANPATGRTIPTTLTSGEYDPTWDAGLYQPASLGNFIWHDLNADGIQDGGETGVTDVVVTLYLTNGTWVSTVTTGVSGVYTFTNLPPDDYLVQFLPTTGMEFSPRDQGGNDAVDSDVNVVTGESGPVNLVSGENDPTIDAGLFERASLGDFVWLDVNGDGVQTGGSETGIPGVVVTLFDGATNVMGVTTTAVSGAYGFANLVPETYFVGFALPGGYQYTRQDVGLDTADSDAHPATGRTIPTTLISGENDPTWDAGLYQPASLGDFIWNDLNANGVQDGGEPGVADVVVTLYDTNSVIVGVTTTDVSGAYAFTNLSPQGYSIVATIPAGYYGSPQDQGGNDALDSDINPATGQTAFTNLVSGQVDLTLDGGLYLPASLGDFAWEDLDRNGVQNAGEPAVPNVTVRLYDAQTNLLSSTVTDASGLYAFTNLVPGVYFIEFAPGLGYEFTLADQGSDAADSDADPATGRTTPTMLVSGESDLTWDAGLVRVAALGDYVWEDLNADGIQNIGEPGMTNVTVRLYDANTNLLGTTNTGAGGLYSFTDLLPGTYIVQFVLPSGYNFSPANQGGDAADSDAGVDGFAPAVTLISGEVNSTVDAGMYRMAELGDRVWVDDNGNGIQDAGEFGIAGVTVTLYNASSGVISTQLTGAFGTYLFTNLVPATYYIHVSLPVDFEFTLRNQGVNDAADSDVDPGTGDSGNYALISGQSDLTVDAGVYQFASIGNRVWEDTDYNALQNTNELTSRFVTGLVVRLYMGNGILYSTTATDTNGYYLFGGLVPGDYFVEFVCPTTHVFVLANQGTNDAVDSDAVRTNGRTAVVTLSSGESDLTWDAGIIGYGIIGDHVWIDVNNDGIHNENLAKYGLNGVRVYLYRVSAGVTSYVATATTATDSAGGKGYYVFPRLPFGRYLVAVEMADIPPTLTVDTTDLSYSVRLRPDYIFFDADFGFNGLPTPVELKSFSAQRTANGVLVTWETATELENLGFNVYRADALDGPRTKVNGALIDAAGTSAGRTYQLVDSAADPASRLYYWLEDVSWSFESRVHGPAVVNGEGAGSESSTPVASFTATQSMALYRIRYEALTNSGIARDVLAPQNLQIWVNGRQAASYVKAFKALMKPGDAILFYAPESDADQTIELRSGNPEESLRMEEVYAAPADVGGERCLKLADESGLLFFRTQSECGSYLLTGFGNDQVYLVDVTDPWRPKWLYGYARLSIDAETGLYFSYFAELTSRCLAVDDSAVLDVDKVVGP